ncbi:MAG: hypothetical protein ABJP02_00520 [Parasphingorhabdus sp.]|uniref:hypothetical protein n=1 Tax=Parasphingorhabdus sp. TaxID=2709688 RepID=UPI003299E471
MIGTKNVRTIAILSLAMVSFGTPAHACRFHDEFGMQRFSPFQAEPYDNSSSWNASLNQHRKMTPIPKTQDPDNAPADETSNDKQKEDERQSLTSGTSSDPSGDKALFH